MLTFSSLKPVQALAASVFFKKRRLLLTLPRQEGKTELGVRLIRNLLTQGETRTALFLAKSRTAGRKAAREKFMRLFEKPLFEVNTEHVYLKKNPTSICFLDSVDKDPDRMRGGTYNMIHWSEVAFSRFEGGVTVQDVYDKILQPTFRQTNGYALLESTNNGKNGWYDLWESHKEYGFARLKISLSDMVYLGIISPEEYETIKKTTHPDVFAQEYECEFIIFQGRAYPEFTDWHIWKDMPGPQIWHTTLETIDWGYDPSATCVLFAYAQDGILNIYDEHYALRELADKTGEEINRKHALWNIEKFICAADHESDRIDELRLRGINAGLAKKVDVMGNRIQIKEKLFKNQIRIHPRCSNLIRDIQAAAWDRKKEGELDESQCTWGHFDGEAALRYLVREFNDFEDQQLIRNPFKGVDSTSAQVWEMENRRHAYVQG